MVLQLLLAVVGVTATLAIHFGVMVALLRRTVLQPRLRSATLLAIVLTFAHLIEISGYAALYWVGVSWDLGEFRGAFTGSPDDYFYYSAITYTTVGFGDVTPPPELRILTAVEALNGIVLVGITTSAMLVALIRSFEQRTGRAGGAVDPGPALPQR